jgi:hypothetical protein
MFHSTCFLPLKLNLGKWQLGPELPFTIIYSELVTDAEGGVVLIGGESESNKYLTTLYRLAHSKAEWKLLPQRLRVGRHYHNAFLVPDDVAMHCNRNNE